MELRLTKDARLSPGRDAQELSHRTRPSRVQHVRSQLGGLSPGLRRPRPEYVSERHYPVQTPTRLNPVGAGPRATVARSMVQTPIRLSPVAAAKEDQSTREWHEHAPPTRDIP